MAGVYPGAGGNPAAPGNGMGEGDPDSGPYPASGERATTLARGPYLATAAAPAPIAAARGSPPNIMGMPIPALKPAPGIARGTVPSIAIGFAEAQPQVAGADKAPTAAD